MVGAPNFASGTKLETNETRLVLYSLFSLNMKLHSDLHKKTKIKLICENSNRKFTIVYVLEQAIKYLIQTFQPFKIHKKHGAGET